MAKRFSRLRQFSAILTHNNCRGSMQCAGTAVVTQPPPLGQYAREASLRQRPDSRKTPHETHIADEHDGGASLPPHDPRDPDFLPILFSAPVQIALVHV